MLARFFKPKWQHQNADVRLKAIEKLAIDDPASGAIIGQLALQDQDPTVRCAALQRSDDSTLLLQASQHDSVEQNRRIALQRLTHLASGELGTLDEQQRLALLPHIGTTELLVHLTLNANLASLRQQALVQLVDEQVLLDIIQQSEHSAVRLQAAQRLETPPSLEQLERNCRGKDKRLYRIARDKLQQQRAQAQQRAARQQRRDELMASLQHLHSGDDFPQFGAKLDALNTEWQRTQDDASTTEQNNWQALTIACQQRRAQLDQARLEAAEQQAAAQARQQDIQALQQQLINSQDTPMLDALTQQWQTLQDYADNTTRKQINQQLETQRQALDAQHALGQQLDKLNTLAQHIEQGLADASLGTLRNWQKQSEQLHRAINWPGSLPQPDALKQLSRLQPKLQQAKDAWQQKQAAQQQQLDAQLESLARHISAGEVRQADRQHNQIQKQQAAFSSQQQQRYRSLLAQLQDLRDWQGYALTPKREALCSQMEALIDSPLAAPELADEIRQLQQQWRALDSSGNVHSRQLWQRFKAASDQAYAPCDQHYATQRTLRQQNLLKREQMCEQLEGYLAQVDWSDADWSMIESLSQTARNEWRQYSPVDRAPGKALQSRFNKQIHLLDDRLKGHRKTVQNRKEALLAQSAALLDMDDVQQATDTAKALQQQWRDAGTTFRAQERKLWSAFRENCNQLFEKRKHSRQQNRHQQRQGQQQLRLLQAQLEQLQTQLYSQADSAQQLATLAQQYQALQAEDTTLNSHQQTQFTQLLQHLNEQLALREQLFGSEYQALKHQADLCQQLETHTPDSAGYIAAHDALQQCAKAGKYWQPAMDQRIAQHATTTQASDALRELCIRLEIALNISSPTEDEARRLEYQMQRLQQALHQPQEGEMLADIQRIVFERLCLPCHHQDSALNARFDQLLAGYNLN